VENPVNGEPSAAARGAGARLVFNTVQVTIDPGRHPGPFLLQHAQPELHGPQVLPLVPGVLYLVEDAIAASAVGLDPAAFYFALDRTGHIKAVVQASGAASVSASGAGPMLLLNR
jgi:hypothetical protein